MANNHYVPQFYLRNFAVGPERKKVTAVKKQGSKAIWKAHSIGSIGSSDDFYSLALDGQPVSLEGTIEREIETPLSQTSTWKKVSSGQTDLLDSSDMFVLFALIRHLNVRTPHYQKTMEELSALSENPEFVMADDERAHYRVLNDVPAIRESIFVENAATLDWAIDDFQYANISIFRTKVRLHTATNPVYCNKIDYHPSLHLPLPGLIPHWTILPLTPYAMVVLTMGNFGNYFENIEIEDDMARYFNRIRLGTFVHFPMIQHLICDRSDLVPEMASAQYSVEYQTNNKVVFLRNDVS